MFCDTVVVVKWVSKTPFTRYRIQMNPIFFHTVLAICLHEDDDEYISDSIDIV